MAEQYKPSFLDPTPVFTAQAGHIDWQSLMHPHDRDAIAAMEELPGFSTVMKWILTGIIEKLNYGENIGNNLKLGPRQLPEYYNMLVDVCGTLGIQDIPELYLSMNPYPNAATCGEQRIYITMTSGLLESLSTDEVKTVLAHECGHILFKHVRYLMLAQALKLGLNTTLGKGISFASLGVTVAFEQCVYRWMRMSEYSADRVATIYAGSAKQASQVIMRLAGGPDSILKNVNYDAFYEQTQEYDKAFSAPGFEGLLQNTTLWNQTHPYNASRGSEMSKFTKTTLFKSTAQRLGTFCCSECGAKMRTANTCVNGHFN